MLVSSLMFMFALWASVKRTACLQAFPSSKSGRKIMSAFNRVIRLGVVLCVAVILSACGTPMGLTKQTTQLDLSKKSVVLATFEVTRNNGRLMPDPRSIWIGRSSDTKATTLLSVDDEGMEKDADKPRKLVLLRMSLEPGSYRLQQISGTITGFLAVGSWNVPLGLDFEVPANSVIYLGRISANLRERNDSEFRAGPMIPLIDQAALGISGATFDVTVSDQSSIDLPRFKDAFAVLRNQAIQARLLPAFDRSVPDRAFMAGASPPKPN